jgi:ethanolamine utilization protein EutN
MYIAKVIGMVVATRKDESLVGTKLLIVQQTDMNGVLK